MNWRDAIENRRSIRAFTAGAVPHRAIASAIELAVLSPAPHHSRPWRFVLVEEPQAKTALAAAMGAAWRADLEGDGVGTSKVEALVARSHRLLTDAPLILVCAIDTSQAHTYPDERRRLAEWSLFAHSMGAALQTLMVALGAEGIGSCWLSAPVFCRPAVRAHLGLGPEIEPHAIVLAGYPDPSYEPRLRPPARAEEFVLPGAGASML